MTTAPNVVVAGDQGLSRKLRDTGRFPTVFDAASATGLRELSKSGRVHSPAAFMFAPGFDEDIPGGSVPRLANGLAASGFTVVVHGFFTERGDVFGPGVVASTAPMSVSDLLATVGAAEPASRARPDLQPEPPPEPWTLPDMAAAEPAARPRERPRSANGDEETVTSVRGDTGGEREPTERVPGHGEPSIVHRGAGACAPGRPLPLQEAVGIAVSVGEGLQALHEEGLVHGDVTPDRILRGEEGPLLAGAASLRGLAAQSAPGAPEQLDPERIDPRFAAPEVLRLQPATAASDVYGLAATLWSLLAGHPPFTADDRWAVHEGALNEAVPRVPRDDVPEWLAEVLAHAMASEPADRYPTARAFIDALEEGTRDVPGPPVKAFEAGSGDGSEASVEAFEANPDDGSEPSTYWEGLTGWAWDDTAPEPGDTLDPQEEMRTAASVAPGRGGRRKPALAALTVLMLGLVAVIAVGLSASGGAGERHPQAKSPRSSPARTSRPQPPQAGPGRVPTSTPTAVRPVTEYTPGRVGIVDGRVSIEVTWADRSGGRAAHYVVGGPTGRTPSTLASAPPGTAKVVVSALNPSVDYCLTVVAVVNVDRVAHAKPVCTHRVQKGG
ncbi:hypothetical protein E1281_37600 [Actinomadura sp. KC345]|uniref:serine/threonine protein kinase n=1 Tax=Actinomadura sp. KC345 TaxID=2530371 RepID=UPI00105258BA|nr:protein kinase [Actinomadura sp. KC345]TDC41195.1 hypothetical protein E1281_37600 [Actinomadura sp. KC345]